MNKIVLNKKTRFIREPKASAGAVSAARNVMHDMKLIFGESVGEYRDGLTAGTVEGRMRDGDAF